MVDSGTKFCSFVLWRGDPDQVFKIELKRASQVIIECCHIHHKPVKDRPQEFFFYLFYFGRTDFAEMQRGKFSHYLRIENDFFYRQVMLILYLRNEHGRLHFPAVIPEAA